VCSNHLSYAARCSPTTKQAAKGAERLARRPDRGRQIRPTAHSEAVNRREPPVGALCRNRTDDLFLTMEMLYRLS
jgi:hypothetical protein